jgi:parallel beta-helix repeat protein
MLYLRVSSFLAVVVGLLALLGAPGFSSLAFALDCGGATPCACGDRVIADRTLVCGVDPVTTAVCPGDGLAVADAVNLNLGGCIIAGDDAGPGILIENLADGVTVQNGRITGFRDGVSTDGDTMGSTVADLQVYGNRRGIDLRASLSTIRNNIVRSNRGNGIIIRNGPEDEDKNLVSGNRADGNEGLGIVVRGSMNTVSHNVSLRNGEGGFEVSGNETTLKQNRADQNTSCGYVLLGARHIVSLNHSLRNTCDGYLVFSTDSTFDRNRADYNSLLGIHDLTDGEGTSMTANTYTGNKCAGNGEGKSEPSGLCQ